VKPGSAVEQSPVGRHGSLFAAGETVLVSKFPTASPPAWFRRNAWIDACPHCAYAQVTFLRSGQRGMGEPDGIPENWIRSPAVQRRYMAGLGPGDLTEPRDPKRSWPRSRSNCLRRG